MVQKAEPHDQWQRFLLLNFLIYAFGWFGILIKKDFPTPQLGGFVSRAPTFPRSSLI
jgi:hypothetical protein